MTLPRPCLRRLTLAVAAAVLALGTGACGGDRDRSPTAPPLPAPAGPTASPTPSLPGTSWAGSWSVDAAEPAGNCMADDVNRFSDFYRDTEFELLVERQGEQVRLSFVGFFGYGPTAGMWPTEFVGTVGPQGVVEASVPAAWIGEVRHDPWLMDFCTETWTMQGGRLSAVLSSDGRRLSGNIVETFQIQRQDPIPSFTVFSHFTAEAR